MMKIDPIVNIEFKVISIVLNRVSLILATRNKTGNYKYKGKIFHFSNI
tara:strand:- start:13122 stop:13265 length:144 start_codon:yes stop_codon:yes gene_type:complete